MNTILLTGTRPEVNKVSPVARELAALGISYELWSISQHTNLLVQALEEEGLTPTRNFNISRGSGSLSELVSAIGQSVGRELKAHKHDLLTVQGDTTSAAAMAIYAFNAGIPVAHIEAGIRSHDLRDPWPEEANRRWIDIASILRFCATRSGSFNLVLEGLGGDNPITGNTGIDCLKRLISRPLKEEIVWPKGEYRVLIDLHRREKWDMIPAIFAKLARLAQDRSDIAFLVPAHPNPVIREAAFRSFDDISNVMVTEALSHRSFVGHLELATLVVTDSGGVQEEASYLGVPALVARSGIDRKESIIIGQAEQVAPHPEAIPWRIEALLGDKYKLAKMTKPALVFGDGTAGEKIAKLIKEYWENR